jgi:uncharacterized damage-inducible protein DinB
MIDGAYVQHMARYNRWQNENLYAVADRLPDEERRRERGAFFGSIQQTLSHLLWADRIWMSRFTDVPKPAGGIAESTGLYPDWDALKRERDAFDRAIIGWADGVDETWLAADYVYHSGATNRQWRRAGFWSRTCSTTRPIIAARCIACSPRPAPGRPTPTCRSCRIERRDPPWPR